jgi:hypothetical protein
VLQLRALIHFRRKQLPAAIEMCTLALRQHPSDTETRRLRAWAYLMTDAPRLALEDFEVCLRKKATDADALAGRATARIYLSEVEGALVDARAAEKHGPLTDRLLYNLTCIYARVADHFRAALKNGSPRVDRTAAQRVALYEDKALLCLRQAMEKLPPERRAAFWRSQVESDPDLKGIRGGKKFLDLARRYGKSPSP